MPLTNSITDFTEMIFLMPCLGESLDSLGLIFFGEYMKPVWTTLAKTARTISSPNKGERMMPMRMKTSEITRRRCSESMGMACGSKMKVAPT